VNLRTTWPRVWPALLAVVVVASVGAPAAVASWRHARDVIAHNGDPVMAPYLAFTTDGMLLAALVVIWVRRHRGQDVGAGPWAAFIAGMAATIGANLAAANWSPIGVIVALWPPLCLAIALELVAMVVYPDRRERGTEEQDGAVETAEAPPSPEPRPEPAPERSVADAVADLLPADTQPSPAVPSRDVEELPELDLAQRDPAHDGETMMDRAKRIARAEFRAGRDVRGPVIERAIGAGASTGRKAIRAVIEEGAVRPGSHPELVAS